MADALRQWMDPRRSWEYRLLRLEGGRPVLQTRRRDETDWSEHRTLSQTIAEEFAQACEEALPLRTAARRLREASAGDGEDYAAALAELMAACEEVEGG